MSCFHNSLCSIVHIFYCIPHTHNPQLVCGFFYSYTVYGEIRVLLMLWPPFTVLGSPSSSSCQSWLMFYEILQNRSAYRFGCTHTLRIEKLPVSTNTGFPFQSSQFLQSNLDGNINYFYLFLTIPQKEVQSFHWGSYPDDILGKITDSTFYNWMEKKQKISRIRALEMPWWKQLVLCQRDFVCFKTN